jgi:hypothetical protein
MACAAQPERSSIPFYRLASHVYVCRTPDYVVLLDALASRYWGVPDSVAHILASRIQGWPPYSDSVEAGPPLDAECSEALTHMRDARMLADGMSCTPTAPHVSVALATRELIDGYEKVPYRIHPIDLARFTRSLLIALTLLKLRPIQTLITRIRSRRARWLALCARDGTPASFDQTRARMAVAPFELLYRLCFSGLDRCLLKSVMLSEFLSSYGLFPQLVIGVATNPFVAHCWLQDGDSVISDYPGAVNEYVPILTV